jgi:N-acylneuraminate cytidylyltransferase
MVKVNLKEKNLIIIPARKGSKSIKNKNIKLFCGKPLIYWTIKIAQQSKIGMVCVSTNCKKIRSYALSLGAEAPFLRPQSISGDKTPTVPVIQHAINFYKNKNIKFDSFFLLQPTSPFRIKSDLVNAWNLFNKNKKCSSVFSVSLAEGNNNPYWMIKKNKKKVVKFIDNGPLQNLISRRQLLPNVYYRNDFFYLSKISNIFNKKPSIYGSNPMILISKKERLEIDINTKKDWIIGEKLFEFMRKKNKY